MKKITKLYRNICISSIAFIFLIFDTNIHGMLTRRPDIQAIRQRYQSSKISNSLNQAREIFKEAPSVKIDISEVPQTLKNIEKPEQKKEILTKIEQQLEKINPILVYDDETKKGMFIDSETAELSNTIQTSLKDLTNESKMIPLHYPLQTIRDGFKLVRYIQDALKKNLSQNNIIQTTMKKYTLPQLINGFTFIHNLDFQPDIQNVSIATIRTLIDTSSEKVIGNKTLSQFSLDLQKKILLSNSILDYFTGLIMKKNISSTKQQLQEDLPTKFEQIRSLAFNQEENKLIAAYGGRTAGFWGEQRAEGTLIIFDILKQTKVSEERTDTPINTACFNNDSINPKILVGLDYTNGPTLTLKNINGNVIQHFAPPSIAVNKAIFNPRDNKQILAAFNSDQNNLLLYNDNGNLIKNFNFSPHTQPIIDIAYSPDGTKIISASKGNQNNLKLWDNAGLLIRSFDKECLGSIGSVAFSSDGKKVVVAYKTGILFSKIAFLIIDISDINKITVQTIPLHISSFENFSFILTKKNQIIAQKRNKLLFFITIDNNAITNMIRLQPDSFAEEDCIYALSPDNKKIAYGGKIGTIFEKNVLYLSTLLNQNDEELLKNLEKFNFRPIGLENDHLKLIYQFWLNSHKGIEPLYYKMDATEQQIFDSFPEQIKRLFR